MSSPVETDGYDFGEELSSRLLNRVGTSSEDRRIDDHDLGSILGPGPRTGCHGDTVIASVKISGVVVEKDGDHAANIEVAYVGTYTRQGWAKTCIQAGHEDRNVSGKFSLRVKQPRFKPVEVTWGIPYEVGEVADVQHDSNIMAVKAVMAAVSGAF